MYPCIPQFHYRKVGFKGVYISRRIFSPTDPELECEAKSKTHGCSNNAQVDNNQCEVPQVEDNDILYVTVHRDEPVVDHVCNLATYPLDDPNGHVGLFTWNGATIYLDNECRAVFVVHWYECVPGKSSKCIFPF